MQWSIIFLFLLWWPQLQEANMFSRSHTSTTTHTFCVYILLDWIRAIRIKPNRFWWHAKHGILAWHVWQYDVFSHGLTTIKNKNRALEKVTKLVKKSVFLYWTWELKWFVWWGRGRGKEDIVWETCKWWPSSSWGWGCCMGSGFAISRQNLQPSHQWTCKVDLLTVYNL